ncbi:unnamed protein product [Darwinula stevensoni]|uniref:Uncharacterized protein n=1 Tax=Darwinula stevensoni TaxID=69355 RepID=A0A7R9AD05_9CRUS|nr:unnamed protein product [Darwinula stevensoni]CAG0900663.1 unnamed protein product [Darwinula stevensoni]
MANQDPGADVSISGDTLDEYMDVLILLNRKKLNDRDALGRFTNPRLVTMVQVLCSTLNQPPRVRFHALHLFEAFMKHHLYWLIDYANENLSGDPEEFTKVCERILKQHPLRLASCVQIASKFTDTSQMTSIAELQTFLRSYDLNYAPTAIMNSEIRILDTLKFKVGMPGLPCDCLETILACLSLEGLLTRRERVTSLAYSLLDYVYLQHNLVYETLFFVVANRTYTDEDRQVLDCNLVHWPLLARQLECDYMLLAGSVAFVACVLGEHYDRRRELLARLGEIGRIPQEDILTFAGAVGQALLVTMEHPCVSQFYGGDTCTLVALLSDTIRGLFKLESKELSSAVRSEVLHQLSYRFRFGLKEREGFCVLRFWSLVEVLALVEVLGVSLRSREGRPRLKGVQSRGIRIELATAKPGLRGAQRSFIII